MLARMAYARQTDSTIIALPAVPGFEVRMLTAEDPKNYSAEIRLDCESYTFLIPITRIEYHSTRQPGVRIYPHLMHGINTLFDLWAFGPVKG